MELPGTTSSEAIHAIQRRDGIVGRDVELGLALAVLDAGRHLLLEGPVGVGKTTIALAVCHHLGRATVRVDGDDRYSEAKLTGWFDPPLVLSTGFGEESFTAGPLVEAMRAGSVLFINELNRMPETVQNVLLPALDEGRIGVPHLGEIRARDGFQVVATQNPIEYVATGHLSEALRDRFEHLALAYQSADEEMAIVSAEARVGDRALVEAAVRLARATRDHPRIRKGASVRAAVATVEIATRLVGAARPAGPVDPSTFRRAAAAALRTRIELRDDAGAGFDTVLGELVEQALVPAASEQRAPPEETDDPTAGTDALASRARGAAPTVDAERPTTGKPGRRPLVLVRGDGALDGWQLAAGLASGELARLGAQDRAEAGRLAVAEVMRRARALVGPLRGRTRVRRGPQREPHRGELDVVTTLENVAGKPRPDAGDWIVEQREEERRQVVLMIDTSGSMAGEPMALGAVAAAVLALKVRAGDLGVVAFATEARDVVALGERVGPGEVVRRLLERPCGGKTNVQAALLAGERQLGGSRDPRRMAVLVSDGFYTAGGDPRPVAARFTALSTALHVLRTQGEKPPPGVWITPVRQVAADAARLGGGRLIAVDSFEQLPRRMLDLAEAVLR